MRQVNWLRVTAWAEIISGVTGAAVMLLMGATGAEPQTAYALQATAVFLAAAAIGELLRRGHRLGVALSAVLQALQLVVVSTGAFRAELQLRPGVLLEYARAADGGVHAGVSAAVRAAAAVVTPNGRRTCTSR